MNTPAGPSDDDAFWRRPDPDAHPGNGRPAGPVGPATPPYAGPPRVPPPPPHFRPPVVAQPPAPRVLPPQDIAAIDEAEGSARTLTYGVGMVAGALAIILMCLLCSRVLF